MIIAYYLISAAGIIIGITEKIALLTVFFSAAALAGLYFYFKIRSDQNKNRHKTELNERQEIFDKIKETNFPVFMNNAKQKYGEIMFKYRLPQNPIISEGIQYWCCDDFLVILPEWHYYQELIYKKYNMSLMNDINGDALFDDMCVINKRDIIYFYNEKVTVNVNPNNKTKKKSSDEIDFHSNKTVLEYRKKGIMTRKEFPEEVFGVFKILIPEKRR